MANSNLILNVIPGSMAGFTTAYAGYAELANVTQATGQGITNSMGAAEATIMAVGLAAVVAGVKAAEMFGEYDRGMKIVQAVSGQTAGQVQLLGEQALQMSVKYRMGIDEITEGLATLGRAGLSSASAQTQVLEEGFKLAKIEGMELNTALESLVSTTSLLGGDVDSINFGKQTKELNDLMVATSMSSPLEVSDIVQTLKYSGGIAAVAGMGLENEKGLTDLMGAISAFGMKGVSGDMAGTAMRAFYTKPASQDKQVTDALERIGLTPGSLWEASGNKMKPISEQLAIIERHMKGISEFEKLDIWGGIVGPKMGQQMLKISASDIREQASKIENSATASDISEQTMTNYASNVESMKKQAEIAFMELGEKAVVYLNPAVQVLQKFFEILSHPIVNNAVFIGLFVLVGQAIRAITRHAGEFRSELGLVTSAMRGVSGASDTVSSAIDRTRQKQKEVTDEAKRTGDQLNKNAGQMTASQRLTKAQNDRIIADDTKRQREINKKYFGREAYTRYNDIRGKVSNDRIDAHAKEIGPVNARLDAAYASNARILAEVKKQTGEEIKQTAEEQKQLNINKQKTQEGMKQSSYMQGIQAQYTKGQYGLNTTPPLKYNDPFATKKGTQVAFDPAYYGKYEVANGKLVSATDKLTKETDNTSKKQQQLQQSLGAASGKMSLSGQTLPQNTGGGRFSDLRQGFNQGVGGQYNSGWKNFLSQGMAGMVFSNYFDSQNKITPDKTFASTDGSKTSFLSGLDSDTDKKIQQKLENGAVKPVTSKSQKLGSAIGSIASMFGPLEVGMMAIQAAMAVHQYLLEEYNKNIEKAKNNIAEAQNNIAENEDKLSEEITEGNKGISDSELAKEIQNSYAKIHQVMEGVMPVSELTAAEYALLMNTSALKRATQEYSKAERDWYAGRGGTLYEYGLNNDPKDYNRQGTEINAGQNSDPQTVSILGATYQAVSVIQQLTGAVNEDTKATYKSISSQMGNNKTYEIGDESKIATDYGVMMLQIPKAIKDRQYNDMAELGTVFSEGMDAVAEMYGGGVIREGTEQYGTMQKMSDYMATDAGQELIDSMNNNEAAYTSAYSSTIDLLKDFNDEATEQQEESFQNIIDALAGQTGVSDEQAYYGILFQMLAQLHKIGDALTQEMIASAGYYMTNNAIAMSSNTDGKTLNTLEQQQVILQQAIASQISAQVQEFAIKRGDIFAKEAGFSSTDDLFARGSETQKEELAKKIWGAQYSSTIKDQKQIDSLVAGHYDAKKGYGLTKEDFYTISNAITATTQKGIVGILDERQKTALDSGSSGSYSGKESGDDKKKKSGSGSGSTQLWTNLALCNKKYIPNLNVNLFKKAPSFIVQNRNFKFNDINVNTVDKPKRITAAIKDTIIQTQNAVAPRIIQSDEGTAFDPVGASEGQNVPSGTKVTK